MRMVSLYRYVKVLGLATIGFVFGIIGTATYTDSSPRTVLNNILASSSPIANACTDESSKEDDIFFLSCGSFY